MIPGQLFAARIPPNLQIDLRGNYALGFWTSWGFGKWIGDWPSYKVSTSWLNGNGGGGWDCWRSHKSPANKNITNRTNYGPRGTHGFWPKNQQMKTVKNQAVKTQQTVTLGENERNPHIFMNRAMLKTFKSSCSICSLQERWKEKWKHNLITIKLKPGAAVQQTTITEYKKR